MRAAIIRASQGLRNNPACHAAMLTFEPRLNDARRLWQGRVNQRRRPTTPREKKRLLGTFGTDACRVAGLWKAASNQAIS